MLKALLLLVGLALTAPAAFAQTAPVTPAVKAPQYEHCLLVASGTAYNARLEFGQRLKDVPQNPELIKADEVVRKMRSAVVALNYMSSQGWECISVNALADGSISPDTNYLLRRAKQ